MERDRSGRAASVIRLDDYRERRSAHPSIVIEPDGSWHRSEIDERRTAAARHPSVRARGGSSDHTPLSHSG